MSRSQIHHIIQAFKEEKNTSDQRHSNTEKTIRTADVVVAVSASVEENRRITVCVLAARHCLTCGTVNCILKEDLGLAKKPAQTAVPEQT